MSMTHFYIIQRGEGSTVLINHLNGLRSNIQFTVDLEKDGTLPVLDTLLWRNDDGSLGVTVYRKPTHMDQYLNFHSHHLIHVKWGLVKCLFGRVRNIVTTQWSL